MNYRVLDCSNVYYCSAEIAERCFVSIAEKRFVTIMER